jgi:hypothetical protein
MNGNDFGRAVSRILSSFLRTERIICLSSQYPKPVPVRGRGAGSSPVSYLALHPMGFSVPPGSLPKRWALTPPFHPYPAILERTSGRSVFCGTVRQKAVTPSARVYPRLAAELRGIAPCGVRTFLPRPASGPGAILRPSKIKGTVARNGVEGKNERKPQ